MLLVQLGGLGGCVGRIRQVRDDGDWSQTRPVRVSHVRAAATALNGQSSLSAEQERTARRLVVWVTRETWLVLRGVDLRVSRRSWKGRDSRTE